MDDFDDKMLRGNSPCPCGRGDVFARCCRSSDGIIRARPRNLQPLGEISNYSNERCYMSFTRNYDNIDTKEHLISKVVINQIEDMMIHGAPWAPVDTDVPYKKSMGKSYILCERHNKAFSDLDKCAGAAFSALKPLSYIKLLTENCKVYMDGIALERWCLKTILNYYYSDTFRYKGMKVFENYAINEECKSIFYDKFPDDIGLFITVGAPSMYNYGIRVNPHLDFTRSFLIGGHVNMNGLDFFLLLDKNGLRSRNLPKRWHRPRNVRLRHAKNENYMDLSINWGKRPSRNIDALIVMNDAPLSSQLAPNFSPINYKLPIKEF